ncbi:MAG: glutathione S-transferase [Burkholderiaceae bacterium]
MPVQATSTADARPTEVNVALLYSFRRCPYAIRARMALAQAGIVVRIREVTLRDKPADMLALSPKGTVPVLQLPDGQVLDESCEIMLWALQQCDPQSWLPHTQAQADLAYGWIARNDEEFKPLLDRYKYATRHPGCTQEQHRQHALHAFVAPLDAVLRERAYLLGDAACWADVALFPFVRQFAMVEPVWFAQAPLAELRRWLALWSASTLFHAVMARSTN